MKHIRIGHVDWQSFLCSTPANDYIFQKTPYEEQIKMAADAIKEPERLRQQGLSTAENVLRIILRNSSRNMVRCICLICMQQDFIHFRHRRQSGATGRNTV